jgi:hypothetical protein
MDKKKLACFHFCKLHVYLLVSSDEVLFVDRCLTYSIPKCICFYSFDSQVVFRFVGTVNLWAGTPHLSHIACLKVDDESLT